MKGRLNRKILQTNRCLVRIMSMLLCILICLCYFPVYADKEYTENEQQITLDAEDNDTINKNEQGDFLPDNNTETIENNEVPLSKDTDEPQLIYNLVKECNDYNICITSETGFDENTLLEIKNIEKGTSLYEEYINKSINFTNRSADLTYDKILNMSLLLEGKEIQLNNLIYVTITLNDKLNNVDLISFTEDNNPEIIQSNISGNQISFETNNLSTYVIISGPSKDVAESDKIITKEDNNTQNNEINTSKSGRLRSPHSSHESTNLSDFLTNVTIVGAAQNPDGSYSVEKNKEYELICTFSENSLHQFDNDAILTYQVPPGVTVSREQTGQMEINIVYKGRTYQIDTFYDIDTTGLLQIYFDQDDPDYLRLVESTNVSFRFLYHASFDGSETHIRFSDDIERDLDFTDPIPGDAYVTKTGRYDEETGTFYYTVKVTATGDIEDINVKDDLLGEALIFNNDVVVSGNSSSYVNNGSTTGFNYTFASMQEGEEITITYSAGVDFRKDINRDGKISAEQTKNSVTVEPEPGDPHTSEYSREINFKYAVKNSGIENGTTAEGNKIIDWSIDYNPLALGAAGGDTITDTIANDSIAYMTYYGNGITVEVKDKLGNIIRTDNISYEALTSYSNTSWIYTIPTEDTQPYSYHITYQTIVNMEAVEGTGAAVILNNIANNSYNSIGIIPENVVVVDKEVESYTTEEISWITTLSVPSHGLTSAVVTDNLPGRYFDGAMHYDTFDSNSLEITGLLPGEHYDVTSNFGIVTITFYYEEGNTRINGLKPHTSSRNIYVRLTTNTDQDWLLKGYEDKSFETHMNMISLNGIVDTASVIYGKPGIEKTGERLSEDLFKYTIMIDGLKEPQLTLTDIFDSDLLEVDTSKTGQTDHMYMYGGTQWAQIWGKTPVSYTDTEDGIILNVNNVSKNEHDQYYPYYMISYYLKLKEDIDLEELAKAHGGKYDLTNTVTWGNFDSTYTYNVRYDYLTKELVNEEELGGINRIAQYRITFNPDKVTLNDGNPVEMVDVLSANLSVDYTSINIETDPSGINIPYVLKGGRDENNEPDGTTVATYTIPDSTKVVITYEAFIRGDGTQTITNRASVLEEEENVVSTEEYGAESEGDGAVASFKIVKVDGHDANKKLSGVKFKVFAENPELDFGENHNYVKELNLETNENGEILLDGDEYDFYFDECYHIREIQPLDDYANNNTDYLVTLTTDMSLVDYNNYVYYYNDVMQIKNYPLEGLVVEKDVISNDTQDKTRSYAFRISILNDDNTVNTNYNESTEDYQFENGIYEFTLKDNEQKMFWGFLRDTKYKVEELDAEGFTTSVKYNIYDEDGNITQVNTDSGSEHSGTFTQPEELIVFTNSKPNILIPTKVNYTEHSLVGLFIFMCLALMGRLKNKIQDDNHFKL